MIKIQTKKHLVKSGYSAVMIVINNKIPTTSSDISFLMELMSDLAKAIDAAKDNVVSLEMNYNKAAAVWHAMNVSVTNDLVHSETDGMSMLEFMSILAPKLDESVDETRAENI